MRPDPKSIKNTVKPSVFFALLGSARIKATHKMLVKLTPEITGLKVKKYNTNRKSLVAPLDTF